MLHQSEPSLTDPLSIPTPGTWRRLQELAVREARRYLDSDRAQDAAQEATLRAWRHATTCSGRPEPWIRTIARREAIRIAARRREETGLSEDFNVAAHIDEPRLVAQRLAIANAMATLPPAQRQTVFLRYWADRTEAEIAAELGTPIGTIKIRLHRARAKLATTLAVALE